ncbi:MAG: hypothetical protein IJJ72_02945 [Bacteroidales bacterium]|nr:hypothetical protein [Bacteroidales bacterium]
MQDWDAAKRYADAKTGANHVPAVASVLQIPANDPRWIFAIPQDEIDANDLIDKNVNQR